MPTLPNPRHETFAQARANGALLDDAYEDAGFTPGRGHASRLAGHPEVAARIAELKVARETLEGANTHGVILALLRLAQDDKAKDSPAAAKEARSALLEAHRLMEEVTRTRGFERRLELWQA